jgi:conjugal transfer/entry exclusion protein
MAIPVYIVREVEKSLSRVAQNVYEGFEQDNLLDKYPMYKQEGPVSLFVEEQTEPCSEEITEEYQDAVPKLDKNTAPSLVQQYIAENYDTSFVYDQLSRKYDYDKAFEEARDQLQNMLQNTEPYHSYNLSYFMSKANSINNLTELFRYATTDGVNEFVEKYAPEYETEAQK